MLYDSKLHILPGKIKSRWIGPFTIHQVFPNGAMELLNLNESQTFKVNGHHLKPYAVPFGLDKEELTVKTKMYDVISVYQTSGIATQELFNPR